MLYLHLSSPVAFLLTWIVYNQEWISNYIHYNVWVEITYSEVLLLETYRESYSHFIGIATTFQISSWRWTTFRFEAHGRTCPWWRHQMETFSVLLAICAGNSPVTGEFPSQKPVTLSFDVFFDLHLNKRLSKQSWGWWFETPSRSLWRHCNANGSNMITRHVGDTRHPFY